MILLPLSRACDEVSLGGDEREHGSRVLEALAELFNPDGEQSLERSRAKAKRRKVRKGARGAKSKQQRAMHRLESGDDIAFPETHDDAHGDEDGEEGADFFEEASDYVAAVSAYSHYDDSPEGGEGDPQEAASSTNPEMGTKTETTKKVKAGGGIKLPKLGIKLKGSKEKGKVSKQNRRLMGNGTGDGDEEEWLDDDGEGSLDGITIITGAGSTTHPADAFQTSATFSQYEKLRIIQVHTQTQHRRRSYPTCNSCHLHSSLLLFVVCGGGEGGGRYDGVVIEDCVSIWLLHFHITTYQDTNYQLSQLNFPRYSRT